MSTLVLLRHGQSEWNKKNLFTGWVDVDLSDEGVIEALRARDELKSYDFNFAFTSELKRAQKTAQLVLGDRKLSVISDKALNERNYGFLQGKNKNDIVKLYGQDQVLKWRRSFTARPEGGESLKDTYDRVVPYYIKNIAPLLKEDNRILVVAHGNSLRAMVMYIENLNEEEVSSLEIKTAKPVVYNFMH